MADSVQLFRAAVLAALGRAPEVIEPGRFHRFSTNQRQGDSAGWCKLFDDLRGGIFGCYRQGISETWSSESRTKGTREQRLALARQVEASTAERVATQRKLWADNARRIARVWAQCLPLSPRDPVAVYLKRRGLVGAGQLPDVLRMHLGLPYWHGTEKLGTYPAMVAPVVA